MINRTINSKRMKSLLLLIFSVLSCSHLVGQALKGNELLTEDADCKYFGSIKITPNFMENDLGFWYRVRQRERIEYYYVNPHKAIHESLIDKKLVAHYLHRKGRLKSITDSLDFANIKVSSDGRKVYFSCDGIDYYYDRNRRIVGNSVANSELQGLKLSQVRAENYSPDSSYSLFCRNHNLFLRVPKEGIAYGLSINGDERYSFAKNEHYASGKREASNGVWTEDGEHFIVYRTDRRGIESAYLLSTLKGRPSIRKYDYVTAGAKRIPRQELYLGSTGTGRLQRIPIDKWTDQSVRFYPIGNPLRQLFMLRKSRSCDEIELCEINLKTGKITIIFHEECKPFFNEDLFHLSILNGGADILWRSERSGRGHYYLYDRQGTLKRTLTRGDWTAGEIVSIDSVNRYLYFKAYGLNKKENPYFAQVVRISLDGKGDMEIVAPELATHTIHFSSDHSYFVDCFSRADLVPQFVVRDTLGNILTRLVSPNEHYLHQLGWRMPEPFTVKASDGKTDLYGYMWKPIDFDSLKHYPIVSHVYPGPYVESIPLEFSVSHGVNCALAQFDFVVVAFGNRGGSPVRDKAYYTYGYGNLRDYPLADNKFGIEQLIRRHRFIDSTRIGIYGHSAGGFMAVAALCSYPDFYKAAVSASGNHDNNFYHRVWGETYQGITEIPQGADRESRFVFKVQTNMELVDQLKGNLMLVTGDMDDNVHPGHTYRLANALISAGKNFDLVLLPGMSHTYTGIHRQFYHQKLILHFVKYLKDMNHEKSLSEMNRLLDQLE